MVSVSSSCKDRCHAGEGIAGSRLVHSEDGAGGSGMSCVCWCLVFFCVVLPTKIADLCFVFLVVGTSCCACGVLLEMPLRVERDLYFWVFGGGGGAPKSGEGGMDRCFGVAFLGLLCCLLYVFIGVVICGGFGGFCRFAGSLVVLAGTLTVIGSAVGSASVSFGSSSE